MSHHPISLTNLGLSFPQKTCFSGFSTQIHYGMRIALIGRNGSGKSTLLKILLGLENPSEGSVHIPANVSFGYVPQTIDAFERLSGGQRLNAALTQSLASTPNILLLDEPTNHLDLANRRSLMRLLQKFAGTLVAVSHDVELLRGCVDTLWHISNEKVTIFSGNYDDYTAEMKSKRLSTEKEILRLDRLTKNTHNALMKEQKRAKNSRSKGERHIEQRKWPTVVSAAKARRAEETSGHKKSQISDKKQALQDQLSQMQLPEIIIPKFSLKPSDVNPSKMIVSIREGKCGYEHPLLKNIFLSLGGCGRLAIIGDNGSGKTTLAKAIFGDPAIVKCGDWVLPKPEDMGYLDQHYATLCSDKSPFETIQALAPTWPPEDIRRHLNSFLFRKNEEAMIPISALSGGEKARLSLAQIAAKTPKLLILDEVTNNLDLETRNHVIQVLNAYPGAMIVISHDEDFLTQIGIQDFYDVKER